MHTKSSSTVISNSVNLVINTKPQKLSAGNSEFFDEFVQAGPADFQFSGGACEVAFVSGEGGLDHLPFHGLARLSEALSFELRKVGNAQVFGCDPSAFRHDCRALYPVFQLTNIARPTVR